MKYIHWTNKDIELLKRIYPDATKQQVKAAFPSHTYVAIKRRASELGLKKTLRNQRNWAEIAKNHKPVIFSA
jgi:hypothetical protein